LYPDSSCDTHQDLRENSALQEESGDLVKSYNEFEKEQTGKYEAKVSLIERGKEDKMVEKPLNSSRKYLDLLNAKLEPKENILLKCHKDSTVALPDNNCLAEAELGYRGRNDPEKESYIVIKNEHGSYFDNPKRSTKAVDQFTAISKLNLYKNPEEYDKLIRKEIRKKRRLMKKQNNSTSRERTCFTKHGFSKIQDKELVDIFLSKKKRKGKNRSVDKTSAVKVDTTSILSVQKPKFYKTTEISSETVRNATTRKVNVAPTNLQQNLDLPKIASRTPVRKLNLKQEDLIQPMPKPINLKSQIKVKSKSFFKRQSYAESAARKITSMLSMKETTKDFHDFLHFNFDNELGMIKKTLDKGLDAKKRMVQFQLPPLNNE